MCYDEPFATYLSFQPAGKLFDTSSSEDSVRRLGPKMESLTTSNLFAGCLPCQFPDLLLLRRLSKVLKDTHSRSDRSGSDCFSSAEDGFVYFDSGSGSPLLTTLAVTKGVLAFSAAVGEALPVRVPWPNRSSILDVPWALYLLSLKSDQVAGFGDCRS